jgi:broad specificity phosphatase PhoE
VTAPDVTVYLVRHGRTALNAEGLLRGHLDVPLDDEGREQAQRLASLFEPIDVAAILTSPLRRARHTAMPIATTGGAPLLEEPRLIDRDYRHWAGLEESILRRNYGSVDDAPDIEPIDTFTHRIVAAVNDITARFTGRRVVVVTHDAVNRHVLASLISTLGRDPARIQQRPGCWDRLERHRDIWAAPIIDAMPGETADP